MKLPEHGYRKSRSGWNGFLFLILTGCIFETEKPGPVPVQSPIRVAPRVFQGDLNGHRGLLFYAAATHLTLVYDTTLCGWYLAWMGSVLPLVNDSVEALPSLSYGPQGPLCYRRDLDTIWRVNLDGAELAVRPRFLNFEEDSSGDFTLHYALDLPDGTSLRVDESPSYDDHYGDIAVETQFRFAGLTENMTVTARLGGAAFAWKQLWSVSAHGSLIGPAGGESLEMTENGVSVVKVTFTGSGGFFQ